MKLIELISGGGGGGGGVRWVVSNELFSTLEKVFTNESIYTSSFVATNSDEVKLIVQVVSELPMGLLLTDPDGYPIADIELGRLKSIVGLGESGLRSLVSSWKVVEVNTSVQARVTLTRVDNNDSVISSNITSSVYVVDAVIAHAESKVSMMTSELQKLMNISGEYILIDGEKLKLAMDNNTDQLVAQCLEEFSDPEGNDEQDSSS